MAGSAAKYPNFTTTLPGKTALLLATWITTLAPVAFDSNMSSIAGYNVPLLLLQYQKRQVMSPQCSSSLLKYYQSLLNGWGWCSRDKTHTCLWLNGNIAGNGTNGTPILWIPIIFSGSEYVLGFILIRDNIITVWSNLDNNLTCFAGIYSFCLELFYIIDHMVCITSIDINWHNKLLAMSLLLFLYLVVLSMIVVVQKFDLEMFAGSSHCL